MVFGAVESLIEMKSSEIGRFYLIAVFVFDLFVTYNVSSLSSSADIFTQDYLHRRTGLQFAKPALLKRLEGFQPLTHYMQGLSTSSDAVPHDPQWLHP
jgi:hypothetical protein